MNICEQEVSIRQPKCVMSLVVTLWWKWCQKYNVLMIKVFSFGQRRLI